VSGVIESQGWVSIDTRKRVLIGKPFSSQVEHGEVDPSAKLIKRDKWQRFYQIPSVWNPKDTVNG
jgi:hypothetical protein